MQDSSGTIKKTSCTIRESRYAAPPLADLIIQPNEPPPVWPYSENRVRGHEFSPLYKSVPMAAERDKDLYELLTLVDAIREGRAREMNLAIKEIKARLAVK